jgi:hypothetical protein
MLGMIRFEKETAALLFAMLEMEILETEMEAVEKQKLRM